MANGVRAELERRLGTGVRALDRLSDEALGELHAAIEDARRRQGETLDAATRASLAHLPVLLRVGVRKILGI